MSVMRRVKNLQPGGRRKKVVVADAKREVIEDIQEHTVLMPHDSRHWQVRLDEADSFGPVTVYNAEGAIVRVIERDALRRPWQEKVGNTWNNCIFPKRNSEKRDKVDV